MNPPTQVTQSTQQRSPSRHRARPEARPSVRWLPLAVMGFLGTVGLTFGLYSSGHDRGAEAQTALVLSTLRTQIEAIRGQSSGALLGEVGAVGRMNEARSRLSEAWQLLDRGGPLHAGDALGVRPISQVEGVAAGTLKASLEALNGAADGFQDNGRGLEAAASVVQSAPEWERNLTETTATLRRQPGASSEATFEAVSADLPQASARVLVDLFPSNGAMSPAQTVWVEKWVEHARAAADINARAAATPGLAAAGKAAWADWATSVDRWAAGARSIGSSQAYRAAAQTAWPALIQRAAEADQSTAELQQSLDTARGRWLWSDWFSLGSALLALVGLLGWAKMTWNQATQQWTLSNDQRTAQESQDQMDQLTRSLRKIVNQDGETVGGARIQDDPTSNTFALTSMINRTLDSREQVIERARVYLKSLVMIWRMLDVRLGDQAEDVSDYKHTMGVAWRKSAEELALINKAVVKAHRDAEGVLEAADRGGAVIQEGQFHTDELREAMQSNAKRLKRLGESTQTVRTVTEQVRDHCREILVFATNAAIEAASLGQSGRTLGQLAQEIDRLAQNASDGTRDIDLQIGSMQEDVQETVVAMEQGTSDLVKGSQAVTKALAGLREMNKMVKALGMLLGLVSRDSERLAVSQGETFARTMEEHAAAYVGIAAARKIDEAVGRAREESAAYGTELEGHRRRI